jgi:ABC-type multidrug transport system fused ATPase/permease subunit
VLALTSLVGILPQIIVSIKYIRIIKAISIQISYEKAKLSTQAEESIAQIRTVKAFANEDAEFEKFTKYADDIFKQGHKKVMWESLFQFLTQVFLYGAMVLVIYVAVELYSRSMITIGAISAFFFYILALIMNIMMMARVLGQLAMVLGATTKLTVIMDHKPKIQCEGGRYIEDNGELQGCIEVKNLKFSYPSTPKVLTLKGVSF